MKSGEFGRQRKIAWTGKYEGGIGTRIYVMNPDGGGSTAIRDELKTATVLDRRSAGG